MSEYFLTDDTALAAYLHLCKLEFLEFTVATSPDGKRKKFVIVDTPQRKKLEEEFYLRESLVRPLDYHDARIAVSRLLKRTITDPNEVIKYM